MAMGGAICPLAGVTGDRGVRLSFDGIYYVTHLLGGERVEPAYTMYKLQLQ